MKEKESDQEDFCNNKCNNVEHLPLESTSKKVASKKDAENRLSTTRMNTKHDRLLQRDEFSVRCGFRYCNLTRSCKSGSLSKYLEIDIAWSEKSHYS